ncbi:MAG: hypothetical protein ACRDP3_05275 [Streptomyces sp.]|uniref:hypothetical protein n=1 Tax=Streptomyces sp. TaxID=1931 RepID=UPI003D6BE41E
MRNLAHRTTPANIPGLARSVGVGWIAGVSSFSPKKRTIKNFDAVIDERPLSG